MHGPPALKLSIASIVIHSYRNMFYFNILRNSNFSISLTKYLASIENHTDCTSVSNKDIPNCFIITENSRYEGNLLTVTCTLNRKLPANHYLDPPTL